MEKNLEQIVTKLYQETSDNITGVGFGYKMKDGLMTNEKSIVFNVDKKLPIDDIEKSELIPKTITISGVTYTTDIVESKIELLSCPSEFYTWQVTPPSNQTKIRPLKGGISLTNYSDLSFSRGTLGVLAVDNETNSLVGVTNNHVLITTAFINSQKNPLGNSDYRSIVGDITTQPNESNNYGLQNSIGIVKRYKPIYGLPTLNRADVALTTINESDINYSNSYQIQGFTGWTQPLEFATSSEIENLLSNSNFLFSAGRTSGAKGEGNMKLLVSEYPVTITVPFTKQGTTEEGVVFERVIKFIASAATTPNGFICGYPLVAGDSGSVLIADINGTRKIVGLCFAGSSTNGIPIYGYANRIDDVAEAINISAWTGQTVNFSNTASTQIHIISGMSSTEKIVLSGKTFWQVGWNP